MCGALTFAAITPGYGTTPSNEELAVLKPFIQIWQQNSLLKKSKG